MARKSKIVYYPNLTIKENAAKNGVSMAGMNYYIRTNNIDRRHNNTTTLIKKCRAYYKEHPNASKGKIAKETGHSRYIVDLYWDYISKGVPYTKAHEGKALARKEEKLNKKVISTDSPIVEVRYLEDAGWKRDYYGVVRCSDTHAYFFEGIPFSNWWASEPYIEYDGKHFTSSEHLFMYFKAIHFGDDEIADKILKAKSYKQAKSLGRKVKNYTDAEWMRVGSDYMYKAVEAKYQSDKVFRDALMDDAYKGLTFVEASPFDNKWGIKRAATDDVVLGKMKWMGSNLLGQTLTRLRDNKLKGE